MLRGRTLTGEILKNESKFCYKGSRDTVRWFLIMSKLDLMHTITQFFFFVSIINYS